jgi:integrase
VRFRRGAVSTYLDGVPWSEGFMRRYAAALEAVAAQAANVGCERVIPGSFDALCVSYYACEFRGLAASTQTVRRNIIEGLRRLVGKLPAADCNRSYVERLMNERKDTPAQANNVLKVLRLVFEHGVRIGMVKSNPTLGVKRYKTKGDGFATWSEDDIGSFAAAYALGSKERLTFALALYTGQRVGDVARMGWQHVNGERIEVRQDKGGATLLIPMHPELKRALASVPRTNLTFVLNDDGAPFTGPRLSNWFGKRCRAVGLLRRTAHGLRKAACRRLAEAGCSVNEIAAISGHKSLDEIARYTRAADQVRLAGQALNAQMRAEGEQIFPTFAVGNTRLDKNG